jgi:hypothetical protein
MHTARTRGTAPRCTQLAKWQDARNTPHKAIKNQRNDRQDITVCPSLCTSHHLGLSDPGELSGPFIHNHDPNDLSSPTS